MKECHFQYSINGKNESIHHKEALAIWTALFAMGNEVQNQHVTIYTDNKLVFFAFENLGAKDLMLTNTIKSIIHFCYQKNVKFEVKWVCTAMQLADKISRLLPVSESKLRRRAD